MHDIRLIRENPDAFAAGLARRGLDGAALARELLARDKSLRELLTRLQTQQARRNEASKLIGQAKQKKDDAELQARMQEVAGLKDAIQQGEAEQRELEAGLRDALAVIPNIPAADVPYGLDETGNIEVQEREFRSSSNVGPLNPPIQDPKQHFEIGEALGQMDFERAAKVSGARFVYLKSDLARLERALGAFMLDIHTQRFGYIEVSPPVLVRDRAMFGTGQLPKFKDDLFVASRGATYTEQKASMMTQELAGTPRSDVEPITETPFWLIPTAEVPLTNYVMDEILNEAELSLRMAAFTPCFRAEAGAAGRDTRGMIRMHQFSKVELVSITTPEKSEEEHELMTNAAQEILKKLDLTHKVVTLCTGDMGFSAQKTYDIEVWLPGQNAYREISSCSNCGPFQALRMNTRYRGSDGKVKGPVHTLNGSGLAVGRTLVAILENYQQPDGSVAIPSALQSYMGGKTVIAKA
ncbi:MAG: serine--tRNA ligase [Rhizomicrobium sp.]